jgi:hypothetical protein
VHDLLDSLNVHRYRPTDLPRATGPSDHRSNNPIAFTALSQFTYHETSFFLVRLLQTFSSVSLALDAQPLASLPPASWKTDDKSGWKAHEKVRPKSHLTMFVAVRG